MEILVVGLAIIHKEGKVLIGCRRGKDEYVEHLTWVFPGGSMESLDFEKEIKRIAKEETGLDVSVNRIVAARRFPEAITDIIAIYFDCTGNGKETAGGDLKELKWVPATSVCEYFTTSVMDEVMLFLREIENKYKKF